VASRYRSQVREVINRNTVTSLALAQGFNVFLPVYDGGVDFILYRESDALLRKVQLKSRWTIGKKYIDREIWIAFPVDDDWYLVPHDELVRNAPAGILKSVSWTQNGGYSRRRLPAGLVEQYASYRFAEIADVAAKAAEEDAA
jgi:hypothetical protein